MDHDKTEQDETRTVGDMTGEEFASMIGGAMSAALDQAGAGRAQGKPVMGLEPEPAKEEPTRAYGSGARAYYGFERSAEIRNLPTVEAREARVNEYLECHDWMVALTEGDKVRAMEIVCRSHGITTEQYRAVLTTNTGASLVPTILEGPIIEQRAIADKLTPLAIAHRSSSGTLDLSAELVTIAAVTTAEAVEITEDLVSYTPVSMRLVKSAGRVVASREQVMDAAASMQMVQNFSRQAGRAFGVYNNTNNLSAGAYSVGMLDTGGATEVVGSASALTDRAVITNFLYNLGAAYRGPGSRLVWCMDTATVQTVGNIVDGAGHNIYPNLAGGGQAVPVGDQVVTGLGTVEGIPVLEFAVGDLAGITILANMDYFAALLDNGIRVETTTEGGSNFDNDTQTWKFVQRQDGAVTLPAGMIKTDGAWT